MGVIQFVNISPEEFKKDMIATLKVEVEQYLKEKQDSDVLLTRNEVLGILHISLSTLHVWTQEGKLKAYGIGNRIFYKKAEILASLTPIS